MALDQLRIATRRSQLAMVQTNWIKQELEKAHPKLSISVEAMATQGDKILDVALAKKQIHRMQTELGAFVFRNIEKGGELESTEAQNMIKKLGILHKELEEFKTALTELRTSSDKTTEEGKETEV